LPHICGKVYGNGTDPAITGDRLVINLFGDETHEDEVRRHRRYKPPEMCECPCNNEPVGFNRDGRLVFYCSDCMLYYSIADGERKREYEWNTKEFSSKRRARTDAVQAVHECCVPEDDVECGYGGSTD